MPSMKVDLVLNTVKDEIFEEREGVVLYKSAHRKLKQLLELHPGKRLRIALEAGGCAGLSYAAKLDDPMPSDRRLQFGDGVEIIIDTTPRFPSQTDPSKLYSDWDFLKGLHIKYQEGILSSSFMMDNPNAQRGCACGISFKPTDYGGKPESCKT